MSKKKALGILTNTAVGICLFFCKIDFFANKKFRAIKPILRFYGDKRKKRFQEPLENIGTREKILRAERQIFQEQCGFVAEKHCML